jgi:Fur family transcriptional regulator, peroxide stress response regulator
MKPRRATRQLAAVYDALAVSHDHPTADQIFRRVRRVLPRVSLGTVYRNLDKLREQGRLRVVRLEGGLAHYDAMIDAHDHFVCERCAAVVDLPGHPRSLDVRPLRAAGYDVHWHTTALYGVCKACVPGTTSTPSARSRAARRHAGSASREP